MADSNASTSEASPDSQTSVGKSIQKSFSCVLCASRKVKCDRLPGGCANCTKARVPCVYKAPPPARRRKKGEREVDVTARLRAYEEALRRLGVDPEDVVKQAIAQQPVEHGVSGINGLLQDKTHGPQGESRLESDAGVLVSKEGRSRYLENGIWTSLQSEFRNTKEILDDSSDEEAGEIRGSVLPSHFTPNGTEILFGSSTSQTALRSLHPEPVQIFKLWQSYLENINPLVKLFHAPTVQQLISDASGDLNELPRNLEALLFGIYCIALESMADGECMSTLGISKSVARQRFRGGAQCALVNASLMKSSDMMVLQAFVLFVLSLQNFDARIIWVWSGIATRIGQRIGLHRDGAKLGMSPFESEIRRRLWWQIMMLEGYSQKLAGTGINGVGLIGDVGMPSNVNDSDLFPGMKDAPKEHEGATEMMFFLIRCHAANFLRRSADMKSNFDGPWHKITTRAVPLEIKDRAIQELEDMYQHTFLQYCDPSVPWHFMCTRLGNAIIFMMRFMAHSAGYDGTNMAQPEKDMLFNLALRITAAQNLTYTAKEMQGFMWHVNLHFQWKAFVFLIAELRHRTDGPEVDEAWKEVEKTFDFHPSFDQELARRALPIALSNLTLKAWEAYISCRGSMVLEPYFIQLIRHRRPVEKHAHKLPLQMDAFNHQDISAHGNGNNDLLHEHNTIPIADPFQLSTWNPKDFDNNVDIVTNLPETIPLDLPENIDWATWDSLFVDFQANDTDDLPPDLSMINIEMQ